MNHRFPALLVLLALVLVPALAARPVPTPEDRYDDWSLRPEAADAIAYRDYLRSRGLDAVVPAPALLRSARDWRRCDASEFAVPPREQWPHILPTLRVVRQLQADGLMDAGLMASGYRDAALNRCAGGSSRSRHVSNNALDFDLPESPDNIRRLCDYWRKQGPALKLGLGFYTDTKIHLDTSGFRTWGSDHTWRTSLCTEKPVGIS
jgi:uncharacterized protein YcbK (DUF882 family)